MLPDRPGQAGEGLRRTLRSPLLAASGGTDQVSGPCGRDPEDGGQIVRADVVPVKQVEHFAMRR
jgi:hypothetical protein